MSMASASGALHSARNPEVKEETLGVTWEHVDLVNRLTFLERTKNGEDRTLPLNDELFQLLKRSAWRVRNWQ